MATQDPFIPPSGERSRSTVNVYGQPTAEANQPRARALPLPRGSLLDLPIGMIGIALVVLIVVLALVFA